jgi:plastocyanin
MNKRAKILFVFFVVLGILLIGCTQANSGNQSGNEATTGKETSVEIKNFSFSPAEITINKGDTIVWQNNDSASHTITSDSGNELDSGTIPSNGKYSHTFNSTGTFDYHCSIHASMIGKVIVK